jgi:hypothetical protein
MTVAALCGGWRCGHRGACAGAVRHPGGLKTIIVIIIISVIIIILIIIILIIIIIIITIIIIRIRIRIRIIVIAVRTVIMKINMLMSVKQNSFTHLKVLWALTD